MEIEYDPEKRRLTLERRGLDFDWAPEVFAGDYVEWPDNRKDYGEARFITVGTLRGRITVIVWTPRGDATRIISMRIAHDDEREDFRRELDRS